MPPEMLFDLSEIDLTAVVADKEKIRELNPQRFEMEQIDGIIHLDRENETIVGYKDVGADEFWVRGHMPGYPLLPGVLICEAAAQICSFYIQTFNLLPGEFLGFMGLEKVRFRGKVTPGDRILFLAKAKKIHRRQTVFNVQGFVESKMVFEGDILGVPMTNEPDKKEVPEGMAQAPQ